MSDKDKQNIPVIGRTTTASFPAEGLHNVPVKVDTGADGSSIWASNIVIDHDGILHFVLFNKESPYYSGKEHHTKTFAAHLIRSSNGRAQVRYKIALAIIIEGRRVRGTFTLADRSQNSYPVLVGCSLLRNRFLVDVSKKSPVTPPNPPKPSGKYDRELKKNPRKFYEKYHIHNERGDVDL